MKIATWNVNSLRVRLAHVLQWLQQEQPDVLALQEIKMESANFPHAAFLELGYHTIANGQKTYNGVAIISRVAMTDPEPAFPNFADEQRRVLAVTTDDVRVINLYVPNGESLESEKYNYKLRWLEVLHTYLAEQLKKYPKLVVLGDFNIAPNDEDVHDPELWRGRVLCSEAERSALGQLVALGLIDSFRLFPQPPKTFSWWDYRMLAFRRNAGLRIDHILLSKMLASQCRSCVVDKAPRRLEQPSDHAPVVATID